MDRKWNPEFIGQLIDVVEDYLEEQGVMIPNEERDTEEDSSAIIYGSHYDQLAAELSAVLSNWVENDSPEYEIIRAHGKEREILSYEVRHLASGDVVCVAAGRDMKSFAWKREFVNATCRSDGTLVETGKGFPVDYGLKEVSERERMALDFFKKLTTSTIRVIGAEGYHTACIDPTTFLVSVDGVRGKISAYPGTVYFNRKILEMLKFEGVQLGARRTIDPSYGSKHVYKGWVTGSVPVVWDLKPGQYSFEIADRPAYVSYKWTKEKGVKETDILYIVRMYGDVEATLYINERNEVLHCHVSNK